MRTRRIETMAAGVVAVRGGADLAAWAALLVESAAEAGQDAVLDLPAAVEWLYGLADLSDLSADAPFRFKPGALERHERGFRAAVRDLLEHTIGQPFRLETPDGPLFLGSALFAFSGGRDLEYGELAAWDGGVEAAA